MTELRITITPPAQMILEQLSPADRHHVRSALRQLAADGGKSALAIHPARSGREPYHMLRATGDLRLLFERADTDIRVLDITTDAQLSFFQRATA